MIMIIKIIITIYYVSSSIGEKFGVEYLYSQTGKQWNSNLNLDPDEPDELTEDISEDPLEDEGFEELLSIDDDPTVSVPSPIRDVPQEDSSTKDPSSPVPIGKNNLRILNICICIVSNGTHCFLFYLFMVGSIYIFPISQKTLM